MLHVGYNEMMEDRLDTYRAKRNFARTPEPEGGVGRGDKPSFVVQKHAARRLHYDFRLEVDGVMPSWAVPRGPSYDPKEKRLAVHVEDHPLDYKDFEGAIPRGEYGGGSVIVWDEGTYENITEHKGKPVPMREAIDRGHVSVWLEGTKLRGGWSLTRTARPGDRQDTWIMIKRNDELADSSRRVVEDEPGSVRSQRRVEDIKPDDDRTWTGDRATWTPPMLAELAKQPPTDPESWIFERKFDGLRALAVRNGDEVELWSRGHQSFTLRFPAIVDAIRRLPVDNLTVDGEIVAYDGDRDSFELLQRPGSHAPPVYEVFDVLHLLGRDTTTLSTADRRRLLEQTIDPAETLRVVDALAGRPDALLADACTRHWEGLIAKRAEAVYASGRSADWRKLKCSANQELVIGGWTDPQGSREFLGALLVGYHDADGALRYAGKVGTGFNRATLRDLHGKLKSRARETSPFVDAPRLKAAHWVRPNLVGEFAFTEWTADGKLRHPRFQGLRTDKRADDVVREHPV
jgi:bifunctional non-homologous end joining protein LigD